MLINLLITVILDIFSNHRIVIDARRLPDIYWNSTNQIFDISNTDHVMSVKLLDRVTIICPQPTTINSRMPYEYTKLYAVSQIGYDNCQLLDERLIGVCQTPGQQSSISIVFRDFSPLPGALEFKPGYAYYFITTSDGTEKGIDRRSGGLCASEHMKIKFEIQPDRGDNLNDYYEPSSAHFRHRLQKNELAEVSTPLLYIIHTSDSSAEGYSASEEEDGAACKCQLNMLLMVVTLIFLYFTVTL
uniref:Ephrin RBD domain-containing protein n=1 Tax=Onchocerca volvulus TaxID=6282 RepID=A0A8R1U0U7_ONCVO